MGMIYRSVTFDGYTPKKDRTLSLRFITQEMSPSEIAEIHGMLENYGYLAFKTDAELSSVELNKLSSLQTEMMDNGKTPGQRMRAILYCTWQKDPMGFKSFTDYYVWRMDRINEQLKKALQEMDDKA